MNGRVFSIMLCFIICLISYGCELNVVSLEKIEYQLFKDAERVSIAYKLPNNFHLLDHDSVMLLREAIKKGSELEAFDSDIMPYNFQNSYLYVNITKKNRNVLNLIYDSHTGYMYVLKTDVHWEEKDKYEKNINLVKKYLEGTYRFRPSPLINKLKGGN